MEMKGLAKPNDVDKVKQACHVQNPACVKPVNKCAGPQNCEYQHMTENDDVDDSIKNKKFAQLFNIFSFGLSDYNV